MYSHLGIPSETDVVRHEWKWFGHLENDDAWVSACSSGEVAGVKCGGRKP